MDTKQAIDLFIQSRMAQNVTDKTISGYDWALDKKLRKMYPEELPADSEDINILLVHSEYLSDASLVGLWQRLQTFFRWLERQNLAKNPMDTIGRPHERPKLRRVLDLEQIDQLFESANGPRDYALMALLLDMGIRVGECVSMRHSKLTAHGAIVSGKSGEREVPMSSNVRELINELGRGDYIWWGEQGPLTESGLQRIVRVTMERSGLKPPKLGPHLLRHTMATLYMEMEGDIYSLQRILGHSSVQTTMLYVHLSIASLQKEHEKRSVVARMGRLTPPAWKPLVDREVFVQAGKKSGEVRRALRDERDLLIVALDYDGIHPDEIARRVGLHPRTVKRSIARSRRNGY